LTKTGINGKPAWIRQLRSQNKDGLYCINQMKVRNLYAYVVVAVVDTMNLTIVARVKSLKALSHVIPSIRKKGDVTRGER